MGKMGQNLKIKKNLLDTQQDSFFFAYIYISIFVGLPCLLIYFTAILCRHIGQFTHKLGAE